LTEALFIFAEISQVDLQRNQPAQWDVGTPIRKQKLLDSISVRR